MKLNFFFFTLRSLFSIQGPVPSYSSSPHLFPIPDAAFIVREVPWSEW